MQENVAKKLARNFQSKTTYKGYPNLNTIEKFAAKIRLIEWFCKLHKHKL